MSVSSTHVPTWLASGTVFVDSGSLGWFPCAGSGPSTPFTAAPLPAIPTQVMSMFGL